MQWQNNFRFTARGGTRRSLDAQHGGERLAGDLVNEKEDDACSQTPDRRGPIDVSITLQILIRSNCMIYIGQDNIYAICCL